MTPHGNLLGPEPTLLPEDPAAALLDGGPLEPGLQWVANSLSMTTLLAEVKESTGRISDLVAAVRSYSQLDRASLQRTDVTEGLESTLVMLAHRLPGGVTVVRDYGAGVPGIEAIALGGSRARTQRASTGWRR